MISLCVNHNEKTSKFFKAKNHGHGTMRTKAKSHKTLLLNVILTVWACATVIRTFSRMQLLRNIGTRAANLAFILTHLVLIKAS